MYFYDTCALINDLEVAFKEPFVIADVTLYELEDIKTSRAKDDEIKTKARKLLHLLKENKDKYTIVQAYHIYEEKNNDIIFNKKHFVSTK